MTDRLPIKSDCVEMVKHPTKEIFIGLCLAPSSNGQAEITFPFFYGDDDLCYGFVGAPRPFETEEDARLCGLGALDVYKETGRLIDTSAPHAAWPRRDLAAAPVTA